MEMIGTLSACLMSVRIGLHFGGDHRTLAGVWLRLRCLLAGDALAFAGWVLLLAVVTWAWPIVVLGLAWDTWETAKRLRAWSAFRRARKALRRAVAENPEVWLTRTQRELLAA